MEEALLQLLKELEAIGEQHEELYDSEVREIIGNAIAEGFIRRTSGYRVPDGVKMYSDSANTSVRNALVQYIADAGQAASEIGLDSFHSRLDAFQNRNVRVNPKTAVDYEDLFGHMPSDWYDVDGNVIRDRVR